MMTDAPSPDENDVDVPVTKERVKPAVRAGGGQAPQYLWMVIAALAALLFASIVMRPAGGGGTTAGASPAELAAVEAELEASRAVVNRMRAEMNLGPLAATGEALDDITARIRKDAETLVALVERSQQLVAERDRLITEKNVEIIRAQQQIDGLTAQVMASQGVDSEVPQLRQELGEALARAGQLAEELAAARAKVAELSESPATEELDVLERRLEEVTRARDFFELRAKELENRLREGE